MNKFAPSDKQRVSITTLINYIKNNTDFQKNGAQYTLFDNTLRQINQWGQSDLNDSVKIYFAPFMERIVNKKSSDQSLLGSLSLIFNIKLEILSKQFAMIDKKTINELCDCFTINLIIINSNNGKLYCNSSYNFFRQYIILLCSDDKFEVLYCDNECIFNNNNDLIKKIITVHKNEIVLFDSNKNLTLSFEDLGKYIDVNTINDSNKNNAYTDIPTDENHQINTETKINEVENNPEQDEPAHINTLKSVKKIKISMKLTLEELQKFASDSNLSIDKKSDKSSKIVKKTKQDLIDELLKIDGYTK